MAADSACISEKNSMAKNISNKQRLKAAINALITNGVTHAHVTWHQQY